MGNGLYIAAAMQMAAGCGVELSHWTHDIGGTVKPVAVGNVIEAYATLLVKERAWDELCSIMSYLARHDSGRLSRFVAGCAPGGVSGQKPPSPPRTQPPLAAWPGLSALPPLGTLPPLVLRLGLLLRRVPGPRRGPAPGGRLSRRDVSAPRVLRVRVRPPRIPRAGKGRAAPLRRPT